MSLIAEWRCLSFCRICSPANMIAQSQSGTGKTAAFVLTMLSRVVVENPWPQVCVWHCTELQLHSLYCLYCRAPIDRPISQESSASPDLVRYVIEQHIQCAITNAHSSATQLRSGFS